MQTRGQKIFRVINGIVLTLLTLCCLLPFLNLLAISFSSSTAVVTEKIRFVPKQFTFLSYKFVLEKPEFYRSFMISLIKVAVGVPVNMLLTIMVAFPLSRSSKDFRGRNFYMWFFIITMVFSGGLIPWYMIINNLGLIDSFWALILPVAVPVYNIVFLTNAFKSVPRELEEAAIIDGASNVSVMIRICVPLVKATIASLVLFCLVSHWNSWFEGLILMNSPKHYPLQSYLQTVMVNRDVTLMTTNNLQYLNMVSERTSRAAQVFIATLPVLGVYPFLMKYFITGELAGAVKG